MKHLAIRQSGGSNIVSIPKAILETLGLHAGSILNLSIVNHKIVLTPIVERQTLKGLLAGSPQKKLKLTTEDQTWLEESSKGDEV